MIMSELTSAYTMIDILQQQLQQSQDSHHWTLNCLKDVLARLNSGEDRKGVARDIEQYIEDLGGVE